MHSLYYCANNGMVYTTIVAAVEEVHMHMQECKHDSTDPCFLLCSARVSMSFCFSFAAISNSFIFSSLQAMGMDSKSSELYMQQ